MTNRCRSILAVLAVLTLSTVAFGQGMLVPKDSTLTPLGIKSQQVSIDIANQVATTTVKQVFANSTGRALEANYVFPLPPEATIRDFAMTVDGKRVSGEVVEAAKARQYYNQIVAQARDPGLLEQLGNNMFRVNIFPVPANGTQTVELTYSQVIAGQGGVFRYVYPLKTAERASAVQDFFSISGKLTSKTALKSIYSPSHSIGLSRKGDNEAIVGLEQSKTLLDKDFVLYWTIGDKAFGLNGVAYRPKPEEPGYLMLLISPRSAVNEKEVMGKDVVFVLDTSGSMQGEKINQAKKAMKFCVESLNEKDRFGLITFSTDVNLYKPTLLDATKENKAAAGDFVKAIEAEGGTNIFEAMGKALELVKAGKDGADAARPKVIVFMTDGQPTVGKTGSEEILGLLRSDSGNGEALKKLRDRKKELETKGPFYSDLDQTPENAKRQAEIKEIDRQIAELTKPTGNAPRIFTFGVGDDVNTKLLDKIAQTTGGQPEYVKPAEDIEVKVSDFFAKASHPVMAGVKLAFGGNVKVTQMLPGDLPDLFFGQQVIAFARYDGSGDVSVTLSGTVSSGAAEKQVYEVSLPAQTVENDFLEPLWAQRKVGYLLDQIRLNGENKELKDEVIALSKRYKIQTPYTSYLVLEDKDRSRIASGPAGTTPPNGALRGDSGSGDLSDIAIPGSIVREPALARPATPTSPAPADMPAGVTRALEQLSKSGVTPSVGGSGSGGGSADDKKLDAGQQKDVDRLARSFSDARDQDRAEAVTGPFLAPTTQPSGKIGGNDEVPAFAERDLQAQSGRVAVDLARKIAAFKNADTSGVVDRGARQAAGRTFYRVSGFWIDEKFAVPTRMTFVKWGSEGYFAIVSAHLELKDAFALGTRAIIVTADGKALVVSDNDGAEKLSDKEITDLFVAAPKPAEK